MSAGEAIIASSELDPAGDLRISFTLGAFSEPGATSWAVHSAAVVVHDIQRDVSESFQRAETIGLKASGDMKILLEEVDGNPDFAERVRTQLIALDPAAVPLYAAALDGFTEDPVGKLRSRLPFLHLSAWLLAHPTVLLGEASGNQ